MLNTAFFLLTCTFVARQLSPLSIEVRTPPIGFTHVKVIRLLIKLCGLSSDASFSNSFPAWVSKQLIHLLPSCRLVAMDCQGEREAIMSNKQTAEEFNYLFASIFTPKLHS